MFPLCHIVAAMAGASAAEMLELETSAPDKILGLAYRTADGALLWLVNLTPEPQQVTIAGLPAGVARIGRLDENNFVTAVSEPAAFAADRGPLGGRIRARSRRICGFAN